ncbi:MAG: CD0415/CD1112 family protein [Peptostreptococcaceae bacterium]
MEETIIQMIQDNFQGFSNHLLDISKLITQDPSSFAGGGPWELIKSLNSNVMKPIGFSLVALFFVIDFLNKSIMFEYAKVENVIKSLLKLVLAKAVMDSTFMFLETCFGVVSNIISSVNASGSLKIAATGDIATLVKNQMEGMGIFEQMLFFLQTWPWTFAMNIFKIIVFFVVYGRMIELFILTAIAPIPIATMVSEGVGDVAKRFFKLYIAVCFQGVIIIIACLLYAAMYKGLVGEAKDAMSMITNMVLAGVVLSGILIKSGTWSKQIASV